MLLLGQLVGESVGPLPAGPWGLVVGEFVAGLLVAAVVGVLVAGVGLVAAAEGGFGDCRTDSPNSLEAST